jgi:hypothetical protein
MKNEGLRRLTDAIRRDREVEVDPNGRVREIKDPPNPQEPAAPSKDRPTKLAPRTFGTPALDTARPSVTEPHCGTEALHNALRSADSLRVFLPVEDNRGRRLPDGESLHCVRDTLLPIAGGATVVNALGSWCEAGRPVTHEPIRVLESFLPGPLTSTESDRILEVLWRLLTVTRQASVAIAIDGRLFLMSADGGIRTPGSSVRPSAR